MTFIKKLVMKGFKSFARETVIDLDRHMNVIVGPNGSGKSNITDALCFVLGRLSIKSIRAAKSSHLIFSGNKFYKPAQFAYVEIVLDNTARLFAIEKDEISLKRSVNKNGQSTYRINDEVRTRQEVLELLSQAGIDPHGFNIVLQGEIMRFVKMASDERRKVIEEVAGISIYEMRKEKSLKELEKTEEKLRQVNAILRERTNYMKNLENEREEALKFQKLQQTVRICKGSIINKTIIDRGKSMSEIIKKLENKIKETEKIEKIIEKTKISVAELQEKIDTITKTIQKSAGVEQDTLLEEISLLKQEFAGMTARKENFENKLAELERRKKALEETVKSTEAEIQSMSKEHSRDTKKELEIKKKKLENFEESRRKYYQIKSNLSLLNSQIEDKKRQIITAKNETSFILQQIESIEKEIKIKDTLDNHKKTVVTLRSSLEKLRAELVEYKKSLLDKEREQAIKSQNIKESEEIKKQVSELDVCPLCKTEITSDHKHHVFEKSDKSIEESKKKIQELDEDIKNSEETIKRIEKDIFDAINEVNLREISIIKLNTIEDKKEQMKRNETNIKIFDEEVKKLEAKKKIIEEEISTIKINDENYENLKLEVNELQRSEERNVGFEISTKQRELERTLLAIKQIARDDEEIKEEVKDLATIIAEKEKIIDEKDKQAEMLKKKYQKMFEERNSLQDTSRTIETELLNRQNDKRMIENEMNNLKIERAQIQAKIDSLREELKEYENTEFLNLPVERIREKLINAEESLARIGSVNLRALEVYDSIKEEYEKIREKVEKLEQEKENIMKVIAQIDRKKKKTFVDTLDRINELFSRNFSELSEKGIVTLEAHDKKEMFNGGLDIIVKVGAGKYFDVTSLSGGEQSLVALSLIFAIQELNPYCFYIFDEIDAALDRRNSEKLAHLFRRHMRKGQYLIITHNDSIISESSNILYGVSMQEGISKVLSLQIN